MGLSCNILQILSQDGEAVETPVPEQTAFVIPTAQPTAKPSEPCPVSTSSPLPSISAESFNLLNSITDYLNAGGGVDELEHQIEELALLIQETPAVIEDDFNGDGYFDLVISILLPSEDVFPFSGQSHIFLCQDNAYSLVYSTPETSQPGLPRFYAIEDLSGDEVPDIILGMESCGAHTCFTSIQAVIWTGSTLENRLQGSSDDLPSPSVEINQDPAEIIVTGEGVASIGAGPNRRVQRQWHWDEDLQSFVPSEDVYLPSSFRIHVLYDADQALLNGDLTAAAEGYSHVQEDDALLDWVDPEIERANLSALAGFKTVLVDILENDLDAAQTTLDDLTRQFPQGTTGASFRAMAEAFWDEYQLTGEIDAACMTAQAYAQENSAQILEVLYFGYSNPSYSAEDVCPLGVSVNP